MRQRDFNNKLETRQKDFANMFAKNTPTDIDFSDIQEEEDGYIDNMDERISEIMSSRENDLKELFDGKLEDAKQLIDTTTPIENVESKPFNNNMKLNIGNDTEIDDVKYISSKKNREQTIENEFPTNEPQKELYELLNNILDNQKVILERLDRSSPILIFVKYEPPWTGVGLPKVILELSKGSLGLSTFITIFIENLDVYFTHKFINTFKFLLIILFKV